MGIDLRDVNQPQPQVRHSVRQPALSELAPVSQWQCGKWRAAVVPENQPVASFPAPSVLLIEAQDRDNPQMIWLSPATKRGNRAQAPKGVTLALDAYRAAACAMWEAADNGKIDLAEVALPPLEVRRESE